jgi:phosphatidylinositol phospholipase C delta
VVDEHREPSIERDTPASGSESKISKEGAFERTVLFTMSTAIEISTAHSEDANEGSILHPVPVGRDKLMSDAKKPEMMSKRTLNWTSTKTPATSVGERLQSAVPNPGALVKGVRVTKITSRGKLRGRVLTISSDKFAIFCTKSQLSGGRGVLSTAAYKIPVPFLTRKGLGLGFNQPEVLRDMYVRYIDVADMDAIEVGLVGTQRLEAARESNRLKGRDSKVDVCKNQIVTIVHHGDQTLDILIPNAQEQKLLVDSLQKMREAYHEAKKDVTNEALLLRYIWYDVDLNRDGMIGPKEFLKILSRINFYLKDPVKIYRKFAKEKGKKDGLAYTDVMALLQQLKNRNSKSMANLLWDEIFGKGDVVSGEEFLKKFLHDIQGETGANLSDVEVLFETLNKMEMNHQEGEPSGVVSDQQLSRARFEIYLHDEINNAFDPFSQDLGQQVALDKPISHYWINTSHNTYLTGDQVQSNSSVEMYMRALRRGCKCLELDCWDGEKTAKGKYIPVVFHGHTLTSKIAFADIISGVKNYMDAHQDTYPIILSLENHCSQPFQKEIALTLKDTLGDYLYTPTPADTSGALPSPESLRGKVVIKGKRPPDPDDAPVEDVTETEEGDTEEDPYDIKKTEESEKKHAKIVAELAQMTLFHGTKFKSFEKSIDEPKSHMHSIGETKISKILSKKGPNSELWQKYNVEHMTRTYPAGTRVNSSNYNPTVAWSMGCQLVALNFQTCDAPLVLNDGRFRQNLGRGYILKPPSIMGQLPKAKLEPVVEKQSDAKPPASPPSYEPDTLDRVMESAEQVICGHGSLPRAVSHTYTFNRTTSSAVKERIDSSPPQIEPVLPVRLKIRVLSGSCLPKPNGAKTGETIDPYVTITVHDVKKGEGTTPSYVSSTFSTATVNDNGFCPVWNEKAKEFTVSSPGVAMVQFSLKESDIALDDKVGEAAIPVNCLRKGYRSIQLYDLNNTRTGAFSFATLLVDIQFADV